jgi:hypothetical protein
MTHPAQKDGDPVSEPRLSSRPKTLSELLGEKNSDQQAKKRKRGCPRFDDRRTEVARVEMRAMLESGDWSTATGIHLVVFFEFLHAEVYGVAPLEVDAKVRFLATGAAIRLVEKFFESDFGACASFMIWKWKREAASLKWRRESGRDPGRPIGWRLQFSPVLVTEYRMHGEKR